MRGLILQLTYKEGRALWIEQDGGAEYMDVPGRAHLVSGTSHSLQGRAVLFPARELLHATMPWSVFDRIIVVAYTSAGWERFSAEMRADPAKGWLPAPDFPCSHTRSRRSSSATLDRAQPTITQATSLEGLHRQTV